MMSSEDRIILDYMAMLNHLSSDLKLRLIMQLTNSLRKEYVESIPKKMSPGNTCLGHGGIRMRI
jgi:hypothetical protein